MKLNNNFKIDLIIILFFIILKINYSESESCLNNCSNHGTCDTSIGICQCDTQTEGESCEKSRIYISSIDPPDETGGTVSFYGYFGSPPGIFQVIIGDNTCGTVIIYNKVKLTCDVSSGTGFRNVTIIDGNLTYFGTNVFYYKTEQSIINCPNNCSNNGNCSFEIGQCSCYKDFYGFDCSFKENNNNSTTTIPSINETTGDSTLNNQYLNYKFNLYSLVEFSIDGSIVNEHLLNNSNNKSIAVISNGDSGNNKVIKFTQFIQSVNCTVEYTIEEIKDTIKYYEFAGISFKNDPGTIKLIISIKNYNYQSKLNNLQLRIKSIASPNNNINQCNNNQENSNLIINSNQLNQLTQLNYLTIQKDSNILIARFLNRLLSDGRVSPTSTSLISNSTENEIIIGINYPHCEIECLVDPDFQILVDSSKSSNNNNNDSCSNSKPKWYLPVVIVLPICVGGALIIIVGAVVYRRNRVHFKVAKNNLIKLNKI